MAGTNPAGWNADTYRAAIKAAWDMATPAAPGAVVFHFEPTVTSSGPADAESVPFSPTVIPVVTAPPTTSISCGVKYEDGTEEPSAFGAIVPSKLVVTLFDVDYPTVMSATYVTANGNKYYRDHEAAPTGLFDVTLHTIHYVAENES